MVDTIGGYRLVRRLGVGERAEVFLGHSDSERAPQGNTAAIKVYREGVEQRSIDREVEVLAGTRSRHLLSLSDLATSSDGRQCLVLPRLGGGGLARLLADRPTLGAGEVVTILAPLCEAIADLHERQSTHGRVRPGSIFFDGEGAPVLACFGRASTFGAEDGEHGRMRRATIAELLAEPSVAEDLGELRSLATALVSRAARDAPTERGEELLAWLDAPERVSESETFARELGARLFELARAAPVDIRPAPPTTLSSMHGTNTSAYRRSGVAEVTTATNVQVRSTAVSRLHAALVRRGKGTLARCVDGDVSSRALAVRVKTKLALVRKRFWVIAGIGIAAVILAIVLVPSGAGAEVDAPATTAPGPRPTAASTHAAGGKTTDEAAAQDDPIATAKTLLRNREECLRTLSVACLDSVDQQGASASDDDSYLIRSLQEGSAQSAGAPLAMAEITLTQRLGDSALLQVAPPAGAEPLAILLVKTESGWRIRDFLPS